MKCLKYDTCPYEGGRTFAMCCTPPCFERESSIPSSELLAACNKLLNYWHSNLYNFQLEKAEDYFRMIERAVNGKDG